MTLIEVLVVIGLLGVLISLLAPSLAGVRSASREVVCLVNLHQTAGTFTAFAEANRGRYPFAEPGSPIPASPDGASTVASSNHWDLAWLVIYSKINSL